MLRFKYKNALICESMECVSNLCMAKNIRIDYIGTDIIYENDDTYYPVYNMTNTENNFQLAYIVLKLGVFKMMNFTNKQNVNHQFLIEEMAIFEDYCIIHSNGNYEEGNEEIILQLEPYLYLHIDITQNENTSLYDIKYNILDTPF